MTSKKMRQHEEIVVMRRGQLEEALEEAARRGASSVMQETATLEEQVRSLREILFLPNYCTHRQLAERLGVVSGTVVRYIKEEGLPARGKLGHNYVIDVRNLEEWLAGRADPA